MDWIIDANEILARTQTENTQINRDRVDVALETAIHYWPPNYGRDPNGDKSAQAINFVIKALPFSNHPTAVCSTFENALYLDRTLETELFC